MPLAKEVSAELRRFADSLDQNPEVEIKDPLVSFYHYSESQKQEFLNVAKLLPRPLMKDYAGEEISLNYKTPAIWIYAKIPRNAVCEIVEPARPAVYRCEPILGEVELEEAAQ
jgi:hypothetical protein